MLGISVPSVSLSHMPTGSSSEGSEKSTEVKRNNFTTTYESTFDKASTIDRGRPFQQTGFDTETQPATRYKFRIMPTWTHQSSIGSDPDGGEDKV